MHVHNIVHADLKLENILLDKNLRANVAYFGLAVSIKPNYHLIGKWGTEAYQTPEQLYGNVPWDHRADYFNVGVILLVMITGQHPFGTNDREIQQKVAKLDFAMPTFQCEDARSFIRKTVCLQDERIVFLLSSANLFQRKSKRSKNLIFMITQ